MGTRKVDHWSNNFISIQRYSGRHGIVASESRASRERVASESPADPTIQQLLQAFYRALELQFLLVLHTALHTHTHGQNSVRVCACVTQCVIPTGTAVLAPCRRLVGVAGLWDPLATRSRLARDSLATRSRLFRASLSTSESK